MKFAANISTMFKELQMGEKFNEAYASGFEAVEAQALNDGDPLKLIYKGLIDVPVSLILMNSPHEPGPMFPETDFSFDPSIGAAMNYANSTKSLANLVIRSTLTAPIVDPHGLACLPGHTLEFGLTILSSERIGDVLNCRKLHVLAGKTPENMPYSDVEETYLSNLKWAVQELEEYNIVTLIEPICEETKPGYFLNSFEQAVRYIKEINSDNCKLLLDVYHLYKIEQDVEAGLEKYLPYAGHIQISQSPGRIDPFQKGDIDYARVLDIIKNSSYDGYIGLEYTPVGEEPDFTWMENYKD